MDDLMSELLPELRGSLRRAVLMSRRKRSLRRGLRGRLLPRRVWLCVSFGGWSPRFVDGS